MQNINNSIGKCIDWQVTVAFYAALHLTNAHLANFSMQYRKHTDVKDALNPYKLASVTKLPETEYTAYVSLQSLARRARYLVNEKDSQLGNQNAFFTYDKHLAKALKHLDTLMKFYNTKYAFNLPLITIKCTVLNTNDNLTFIQLK